MKPIVEKILASGLIDRHMTKLLESWGYLPTGSVDKVKEDALKNTTQAQLIKLAEELADELDSEMPLRETILDIGIAWPFKVDVFKREGELKFIAGGITAMVDRLGRFYFRIEEVKPRWIVPGYILRREVLGENGQDKILEDYEVFTRTIIYSGDLPVALEVIAARVCYDME